jgi:hypothetical protein
MANNEKFASDMRDALKAMMEADPYYSDIPIITERLQNIDAKVEQIVGKAGGICIVLVTASFEDVIKNVPGANFDTILFIARVFENVKTNPTGKEAQDVAIHTGAYWSQLKPDTFANPLSLDSVALGNDPRFLTWDTTARTNGGTKIEIPRLGELTLDLLAGPPLISCPQPGAAIFYTYDRSYPAPRNPAATFFDINNGFANYPPPNGTTYDDGVRHYEKLSPGDLTFFSPPPGAGTFWRISVTPALMSVSGNEEAVVQHFIDDVFISAWGFRKIDGAWTLFTSSPGPDTAPPAPADGYSFFPATTLRARAWLAGYIPSAELRQVI